MRFYAHITSYYYCLLPGQLNLGCWEESDADAASPNSCPGSKLNEQREELPVSEQQRKWKNHEQCLERGKEDAGNLSEFFK